MWKILTAALLAASVIAAPALAAGTGASEPAAATAKSDASGARHHVRHAHTGQ